MILDEVRGQDRVTALLRRALDADRLGHAYLFTGPPGVGKRTTAFALARACLCSSAPGRGCGACPECRLVAAGSHPDLFIEDLERARIERPTTSNLSIDQVRRVRAQLALRPVRGRRKLGLIEPAERLTHDAQNALLKTLEEPSGMATLILVTTNADALLSTIRSRCQRLRFLPLGDEVVEALLVEAGMEEQDARRAAALADGSLDAAREMASGDVAERARSLAGDLEGLAGMPIPQVLDLASSLAPPRIPREQQGALVATVVAWCRHEVHRAAAETPGSGGEGVAPALERLRRAYATSRDLERSANVHLAWDCLLLDLRASLRQGP